MATEGIMRNAINELGLVPRTTPDYDALGGGYLIYAKSDGSLYIWDGSTETVVGSSGGGSQTFVRTSVTWVATSTRYFAPTGDGADDSSETRTQVIITKAGTLKNLRVKPRTNGSIANTKIVVRKNAVDTDLEATIPLGSTDEVTDLVNTVSVVPGDLISLKGDELTNSSGNVEPVISFQVDYD